MAVQAAAKRAAARPRVVKRKPVLSKFVAKAILARKRASTRTASAAARRAVRPSAAAAGLKCVVINLKARPDRWLALQKTAQKNAPWLKLERLDAVNGREHPPAEKDVCKSYRTLRLAKLFHWYRDREVTMSGVRSKKPDKKPDVRSVAQFMCGCKAREVWDYSRANLAQFSKDGLVLDSLSVGSDVVARWVPPGYTALLEGGADLWSKTRKDDKLAFLGKLKSRPDGVLNSLHQTPFWKGRVHEEGNVWNIQNLGRFVSEYPMQLILHKNQMCCPSDNVLETFRLAQLLPNKACVISATVHPLDADGWGGIVHFFGNMSEAEAVVSGLRKDVRACQRRSYALYKARFDSSKILAESGFLDMWNGGAH